MAHSIICMVSAENSGSTTGVMIGQRRVDPLAAIFIRHNQSGNGQQAEQEYQKQSRDVNNTRQGSRSQAQSSKVGQSGVKHRDSRMNNAQKCQPGQEQDFAVSARKCAAYMWVSEWGAGVVRQSRLMSEWWQLCDWCNGGRECVCAVNDGRCSPWVICSSSVVSGDQIRDNWQVSQSWQTIKQWLFHLTQQDAMCRSELIGCCPHQN